MEGSLTVLTTGNENLTFVKTDFQIFETPISYSQY